MEKEQCLTGSALEIRSAPGTAAGRVPLHAMLPMSGPVPMDKAAPPALAQATEHNIKARLWETLRDKETSSVTDKEWIK